MAQLDVTIKIKKIKIKITNQYAHLKKQNKNKKTNRVVNNWNSLPSNIVLAGTLTCFKNLPDKYWKQNTYVTR